MRRSVFYFPDPKGTPAWRVAIAEVGEGTVVAVPHGIDHRWCGDVPRILAVLAAAPALDGTSLPEEAGPQVVLGDLVRVTYQDGRVVELDERTPVGWRVGLGDHDRLPSYKLMAFEPKDGPRGSVYFHDGPRSLPIVSLTTARGQHALIDSGDGGTWLLVYVESWEEEARRLRVAVAALCRDG